MLKGIFLCIVVLLASQANAKILRLGMEYTSFSDAHTAASVGDTIQVYGGSFSGTATKRLVIIGFGYNFDVHPGLQAVGTDKPSQLDISFNTGSDSSIVEGIDGTVNTYVSKIIVRRCRATVWMYNTSRSISDVKIISSVFTGGGQYYYNSYPCTNFLMYNCIIGGNVYFNYTNSGTGSSGAIINCVSTPNSNYLDLGQSSFLVKNCILYYSNATENINTVYESNFFSETKPSSMQSDSTNKWGQTWGNLFNRLGGTSDNPAYYNNTVFDENYYILKAGSLAINGGTNAQGSPTDAGIFGGEPIYQYRLSGVPAVPSIYKLTSTKAVATSNPYNVTISVRSNN